jgi:hypothetical protein
LRIVILVLGLRCAGTRSTRSRTSGFAAAEPLVDAPVEPAAGASAADV